MPNRIVTVDAREYEDLADRVRPFERILRDELRRELTDAGEDVAVAVRRAALSLPGHGPDHTGLRAGLARGVRTFVRTARGVDVRVEQTTGWLRPDQRQLPWKIDSPPHRWRHPNWGNRQSWSTTRSGPYFRDTARRRTRELDRRVGEALQRAADRVT